VSVHIKRIDREVVGGKVERLEHLSKGEVLAITVNDDFVRATLHLALDETEHVLLVHAGRVVDVSVDLQAGSSQFATGRIERGKGKRKERKEKRTFRTL
jgi:hypothetical protein